jgi:uncharacterized membrane protein YccC
VRAAIGTTVSLVLALTLLPGTPAGVLAAFGSMALLGTADFGGSARRRTVSIMSTGVAGALLVVIGGLAAASVWSIVPVTFVVTGTLAFLVALRGTFASACPALTTVYVASAMVTASFSDIPDLLAGWAIAVVVALPVTLLILPRRNLAPVRRACVGALRALAAAAHDRSQGKPMDPAPIDAAHVQLRDSYLGNPFRAAGLNHADRALQVLVGQLEALLTAMTRGSSYSAPASPIPDTAGLILASADALDAQAGALEHSGSPAPRVRPVADLWGDQWNSAVRAIGDDAYGDPATRVTAVNAAFPDRAFAIAVIRLGILIRRALGQPPEDLGASDHTIPQPPIAHPWRELASQVTLRSPWMRTALRTGVALALATLVVEIVGLAHGFWVVLGVIATLRVDGVGTLRTSMLAVAGTFAGALVGYVLLVTEATHPTLMWISLVVVIFLAVYTQATTAYIIGQAAFSLFVIVAFSVINWPPQLQTVDERFTDILVGAAISAVVALLMWPRGVATGLLGNVTDAIRQGCTLLTNAVEDLLHGPGRVTPAELTEMSAAFSRSREVVEVSLSSRSADAIQRAQAWEGVIDNMRTLTVSAHLIADWSSDGPPIATTVPPLTGPLQEDLDGAVGAWQGTIRRIDGEAVDPGAVAPDSIAALQQVAAEVDLTSSVIAGRMVSSIWTHGWIHMTYRAGMLAPVPAAAP